MSPPPASLPLDGARVLIIGGSSGIGLAIAEAARTAGADLMIAARSLKRLIAAKARLEAQAAEGAIETLQLDLGDEAAGETLADLGSVDHLVLTGGSAAPGPIAALPWEEVSRSIDSRLLGPLRVLRAVRVRQSLLLTSGGLSRRPMPDRALIAALNAATEGLTRGLAVEMAPVRVNCLSPGLIDTPLYAGMAPADRAAMLQQMAAALPVGRVGAPPDVAQAAMLLLTNGFITGAVLDIDGGWAIA